MDSSLIRATARESLRNKWGKAALLTFIYAIIIYLIYLACRFIPLVGTIGYTVVSVPLTYGLVACFIKLKRNEDFGYLDFLTIGFSSFGKIWSVTLNTALKMIVPIVLMIVFYVLFAFSLAGSVSYSIMSSLNGTSSASGGFGIMASIAAIGIIATSIYAAVKGLLYSLNNYILYDNPNMSGKEIVEKSASLMYGNRGKLFWLELTFIGWAILASLAFGIGYFWLIPYMTVSLIVFYEVLVGVSKDSNSTESSEQNEIADDTQDNPIKE